MRILYFAWVREKVGLEQETIALPDGVTTVGELIAWLAERSQGHHAAFSDPAHIRTACNRVHVDTDAVVTGNDEVAFFPPITGG